MAAAVEVVDRAVVVGSGGEVAVAMAAAVAAEGAVAVVATSSR